MVSIKPGAEQHAGWAVQPVCTLCLIAKRVGYARHWVPSGTKTCLRHQRWTGVHGQQFDISPLPEIAQAQRRHHNLIRRYGWQLVTQVMRDASSICWNWWDTPRFRKSQDRRRKVLRGPAWSGYSQEALVSAACGYPDIVSLADLMISPALRALVHADSLHTRQRVVDEVRAHVIPGYGLLDLMVSDPLALWVEKERHHRTLASPGSERPNA